MKVLSQILKVTTSKNKELIFNTPNLFEEWKNKNFENNTFDVVVNSKAVLETKTELSSIIDIERRSFTGENWWSIVSLVF